MYKFNSRIKKLQIALKELPNKFKIIFADGNSAVADNSSSAVKMCMDENAVRIECTREQKQGDGLLLDVLRAVLRVGK